jgi:hypothetical protein
VVGDVGDIEGYPPLPEELRASIRTGEWRFPADLPLSELQSRLADRLRREHDLAEVSVRVDDRARATVRAAPPLSGLSKRVPAGERAVSVSALLPTGLAAGDEVDVHTAEGTVSGTVVGARSDRTASAGAADPAPDDPGNGDARPDAAADGDGDPEDTVEPPRSPRRTTAGGQGRVTVAVDRTDAPRLLGADSGRLVVRSRGHGREFELLALLRRAGRRFRRLTVGDGELAGDSLGSASVRERYGVAVLAVRLDGGWRFAPRGGTRLSPGDELFAVGPREGLDRFAEAVGR